jgi:hypothetical protein
MLFSSSAVASVAMLLLGEDDTLKKTTEEAEAAKAAADAEAAAKAAADAAAKAADEAKAAAVAEAKAAAEAEAKAAAKVAAEAAAAAAAEAAAKATADAEAAAAAAAAAVGIPDIVLVRLTRPPAEYPNNIINLAEVEVYNTSGVNVARGKNVRGILSSHPAGPFERLVDGSVEMGNFAHTGSIGRASFIDISLGSPETIREIVIHNRKDCCQDRTQNMVVQLAVPGAIVYTTPPVEPGKDKMTFNFRTHQWTY